MYLMKETVLMRSEQIRIQTKNRSLTSHIVLSPSFSRAAGGGGAEGDDGRRGQQHLSGVSAPI